MKLITRHELTRLSLEELHGVYKKAFNELAINRPESITRTNAIASLQNIDAERSRRLACKR
ncbi:MAG: hypothetical protein Hals2KO_14790 [Halioglobus sp.]